MSVIIVPPLEDDPWPTLGPQVCDWIEDHLVYGPGEKAGEEYVIEPDFRALIYRMYEVYPADHKSAGRRRFKRAAISVRKGSAKTERAALLSIVEAHPTGPVRCDGFDAHGEPVGISVAHPYIPLVAFSEEQVNDLAFGVARYIVENSEVVNDFDIGLERLIVIGENGRDAGRIVPLGGSPNARDGARTTFQHVDESHRLMLPRLKKAHNVMIQNTYKRIGADAWTLETTTTFSPGEDSVAENTHHHALEILKGRVDDPRLFYYHRQADEELPMTSREEVLEALIEASGPAASWSGDLEALADHWFEPGTDRPYYRRVWLNQPIPGGGRAFKPSAWAACGDADEGQPDPGALVVLGFDGARRRDSTVLYAFDVDRAHGFPLGIWERPHDASDEWEIDSEEVDAAVADAFERFDVWRMYADPPWWEDRVDSWAGTYGEDRVIKWWTNRQRPMALSLQALNTAMEEGLFTHDENQTITDHVHQSFRHDLLIRTDNDEPLWHIRKERPDSPNKIDGAMAMALAWEARGDCIAKGSPRKRKKSLVTFR